MCGIQMKNNVTENGVNSNRITDINDFRKKAWRLLWQRKKE